MIGYLHKYNYYVASVTSIDSLSRIWKGTTQYVFAVRLYFRHSQIHLTYRCTTGLLKDFRFKDLNRGYTDTLYCIWIQHLGILFLGSSLHNCCVNSVPYLVKWSELLPVLLISQRVAVRLHTPPCPNTFTPSIEQRPCVPCASHSPKIRGGTALLAFEK